MKIKNASGEVYLPEPRTIAGQGGNGIAYKCEYTPEGSSSSKDAVIKISKNPIQTGKRSRQNIKAVVELRLNERMGTVFKGGYGSVQDEKGMLPYTVGPNLGKPLNINSLKFSGRPPKYRNDSRSFTDSYSGSYGPSYSSTFSGLTNLGHRKSKKKLSCDIENCSYDIEGMLKLFENIVNAVQDVHDNDILHRDIKLENILIDEEGKVTVIDFGEASDIKGEKLEGNIDFAFFTVGTPQYMAPELYDKNSVGGEKVGGYFSAKQDIFSTGVTLAILMKELLDEVNPNCYEKKTRIAFDQIDGYIKSGGLKNESDFSFPVLQDVKLDNPENDPRIDALNSMISIVNKMTTLEPDERMDLDDVSHKLRSTRRELESSREGGYRRHYANKTGSLPDTRSLSHSLSISHEKNVAELLASKNKPKSSKKSSSLPSDFKSQKKYNKKHKIKNTGKQPKKKK